MHKVSTIIDNVNNVKTIKTKNVNNVKYKAQTLAERLDDPGSLNFFLKVAWHLPESVIEANLEQALKGNEPRKYFTWLCKRSLTT